MNASQLSQPSLIPADAVASSSGIFVPVAEAVGINAPTQKAGGPTAGSATAAAAPPRPETSTNAAALAAPSFKRKSSSDDSEPAAGQGSEHNESVIKKQKINGHHSSELEHNGDAQREAAADFYDGPPSPYANAVEVRAHDSTQEPSGITASLAGSASMPTTARTATTTDSNASSEAASDLNEPQHESQFGKAAREPRRRVSTAKAAETAAFNAAAANALKAAKSKGRLAAKYETARPSVLGHTEGSVAASSEGTESSSATAPVASTSTSTSDVAAAVAVPSVLQKPTITSNADVGPSDDIEPSREGSAGSPYDEPPEVRLVTQEFERGRPGQSHRCPAEGCVKTFVRKSDFLRHYRIHTGERPFMCPVPGCSKTFIQRSALTVHLRTHTGDKPLACDLCGRAFSDSSSLARHRRVHSGEKRFHCERCNQRQFSRKITLVRHLEICDGTGDLRNRPRAKPRTNSVKVHASVAGGDGPASANGEDGSVEQEEYDEDRDADGEADYENEDEFNAALVLAGGNTAQRASTTPTKSSPVAPSSKSMTVPVSTPAVAAAGYTATPGAKRDAPPVKRGRQSLPAGTAAPSQAPSPPTTRVAPSSAPRPGAAAAAAAPVAQGSVAAMTPSARAAFFGFAPPRPRTSGPLSSALAAATAASALRGKNGSAGSPPPPAAAGEPAARTLAAKRDLAKSEEPASAASQTNGDAALATTPPGEL